MLIIETAQDRRGNLTDISILGDQENLLRLSSALLEALFEGGCSVSILDDDGDPMTNITIRRHGELD